MGIIAGGDVCTEIVVSRKTKIKIKLSKKLLDVSKEYTNVEGATNCKAATSTTRQCNNNDNNNNNNNNNNDNDNDNNNNNNNNNIKERLVWSG